MLAFVRAGRLSVVALAMAALLTLLLGLTATAPSSAQAAGMSLKSQDITVSLSQTAYYFNGVRHKPKVTVIVRQPAPDPEPDPEPEIESRLGIKPLDASKAVDWSQQDLEGFQEAGDSSDEDLAEDPPEPQYVYTALRYGVDYTISRSKGKYSGTAYVTVKGKGKYCGTVKKSFKVISRVKYVNQFKLGYPASRLVKDANAGYPCLAIVTDSTWREHCIVVIGGTSKVVAVMDPIRGYRAISMKTFKRMYAGWGKQSVRIAR